MKMLSLKLDDALLEETDKITAEMKIARNRYIKQALEAFNELNKKRILNAQLRKASKLVAANSMEVLAEFEALEDDHEELL